MAKQSSYVLNEEDKAAHWESDLEPEVAAGGNATVNLSHGNAAAGNDLQSRTGV